MFGRERRGRRRADEIGGRQIAFAVPQRDDRRVAHAQRRNLPDARGRKIADRLAQRASLQPLPLSTVCDSM